MNVADVLNDLSSKKSFLIGLVFISKADKKIDDREMMFFNNAGISLGLDESSLQDIASCWHKDVCPRLDFSNMIQKKLFIREAIQLSQIDEHYAEPERELIFKIANELGVSDADVEALENWVFEGISWQKKGNELIGMEE